MPPRRHRFFIPTRIQNRRDLQKRKFQPAAAFYEPKVPRIRPALRWVRTAEKPDEVLLDFAQSTYDAASTLGKWDRDALQEVKPSLHFTHPHS